MREDGIRDDVAPWSFFLPVTLAVIVGGVAAGLIGRGIDAVFGSDAGSAPVVATPGPAAAPMPPAMRADEVPRAAPTAPSGTAGAAAAADGDAAVSPSVPAPAAREAAPVQLDAAPADALSASPARAAARARAPDPTVPVLPGAIVARRDGAPEACINGTIATRDVNGWQQRLENDAPVACVEQATVPP